MRFEPLISTIPLLVLIKTFLLKKMVDNEAIFEVKLKK